MALSHRLMAVLDLIYDCEILTDIGTDHGLLPIEACNMGLCERAIACDIGKGPLEVAKANIKAAGLSHRIETRLGDGLKPLHISEVDCIVISGMGGMRIWGILSEGMSQARQAKRLILQPQHDTELLRRNLHKAGIEIEDEQIVREVVGGRQHFYVVIAARYTGESFSWSEQEYFLGRFLISKGGDDFSAFTQREKEKISVYMSQIRDKSALQSAKERLNWL